MIFFFWVISYGKGRMTQRGEPKASENHFLGARLCTNQLTNNTYPQNTFKIAMNQWLLCAYLFFFFLVWEDLLWLFWLCFYILCLVCMCRSRFTDLPIPKYLNDPKWENTRCLKCTEPNWDNEDLDLRPEPPTEHDEVNHLLSGP